MPSNRLAQETTFEEKHGQDGEVWYLCAECDEDFTIQSSSNDKPRFCPMCGRRAA